jgi:hypothetical protein
MYELEISCTGRNKVDAQLPRVQALIDILVAIGRQIELHLVL